MKVYAFGANSHGQLGSNDFNDYSTPRFVFEDECIVEIFAGGTQTFIKTPERLLMAGKGSSVFASCEYADFVACGFDFEVYMRNNEISCLEFGSVKGSVSIVAAGVRHFLLYCNNQVISVSKTRSTAIPEFLGAVKQIASGHNHSLVMDCSNNLFICGSNKFHQINGTDSKNVHEWTRIELDNAIYMSSGWNHSAAITKANGVSRLYTWGRNDRGQLGHSNNTIQCIMESASEIKVVCGSEHTLVLCEGIVYACGWNEHGNCGNGSQEDLFTLTVVDTNAVAIYSGYGHSFIVKN